MSTQHTPAPWWLDDDGFIASGSGDDYKTIADPRCMEPRGNEAEMDANARLIAAAPEMLDALRLALTCLDAAADGRLEDVKDEIGGTANIVDEVIYKATK